MTAVSLEHDDVPADDDVLLDVRDLSIAVRSPKKLLVDRVSFAVRKGETLAIVGESGSGKTITSRAILGLLPRALECVAGTASLSGHDLLAMGSRELATVRGRRIASVFQEPATALNPVMRIGKQVAESLRWHGIADRSEAKQRAIALLGEVGLPEPEAQYGRFPYELSGGMKQRVAIAIALACEPDVLIADEPTTALDVTTQAQILRLVERLKQRRSTGIVWITHDLGVVAGIADRILVMYGGRVLEEGPTASVLGSPAHPYTRGLLRAIPRLRGPSPARLEAPTGGQSPGDPSRQRCVYWERCTVRSDPRCASEVPPLRPVGDGHRVATFCAQDGHHE